MSVVEAAIECGELPPVEADGPWLGEKANPIDPNSLKIPGFEYDHLVRVYKDHPLNTHKARQKRDLEDFGVQIPRPCSQEVATAETSRGSFARAARQYPTLDGLEHEKALKVRIETGLAAFDILSTQTVSNKEALELDGLAAVGAGAFLTMFESNLRLVMFVANKYPPSPRYGVVDAMQDGCFGLRRAIQMYNPNANVKFSTYATDKIKALILEARARNINAVGIDKNAESAIKHIYTAMDDALNHGLPTPSPDDLVKRGYRPETIRAAFFLCRHHCESLDEPKQRDHSSDGYDYIGVEGHFEPVLSDMDCNKELNDLVKAAQLTKLQREVLSVSQGVFLKHDDYERVSLKGIIKAIRSSGEKPSYTLLGNAVGLSRERARQVMVGAIGTIILTNALPNLSTRLNLSEHEFEEINKYLTFAEFSGSKYNEAKGISHIQHGLLTIELLGLLDQEIGLAIDMTIDALRKVFKIDDGDLRKQRKWLACRFGVDPMLEGKQVTLTAGAKKIGAQPDNAKLSEAVLISILAGTWGKLPQHLIL